MKKVSELLARYRKPVIGFLSAIVLYALLGFLVAPWLLKKVAVDYVEENLGATLDIEKVAINPFVMSLGLDNLKLDSPDGDPALKIGRYFVNFQSSSLFRWAWTFREFHVDGLEFFVHRDDDGNFNIDFLMQTPDDADAEPDPEDSGPARLLIHDFAIRNSVVHWSDDVPPEPVDTAFGPVNIVIAELNTLPDRQGSQDVLITTETQGTLSWNGSLQLNPLNSEGSASITGSHFPLTSAYLKYDVGFELVEGVSDVDFNYRVHTVEDGSLQVEVSDFNLAFSDLLLRTFNEAVGRPGEDREVLRLPRLSLSGGDMRWPEQTVSVESVSIDGASIQVYRDAEGALNVLPPAGDDEEVDPGSSQPVEPGTPWQVALDRFTVNELVLDVQDDSVTPSASTGWQSLDLEIRDVSNAQGASFPTNLSITARDGGTVTVDGTIAVLPDPVIDFDITVDALDLAPAVPYLTALADVQLDSGALNVSAAVRSSPEDALHFSGDVEVTDFLITETDEGSRLGSWDSLFAENVAYTLAGNSLQVSEVRLAAPYGDILIAEDGSVNLGRVQKDDGAEPADTVGSGEESPEGQALAITIGRISIADAAADFADRSLPLPFSAQIADMNGELSTISTASAEPSSVSLEGKVDEFGQVRVSGTLTPLDPPANTNVRVVFQNVDMPKFSAYSIPFAGREIASGRLDLDLGYKVVDRRLAGENNIVLRDFELGDEVEHPGAMSLPLGLAVALLKDREGKIDIDLPVEGDLDDPEFRIGGVVLKALANLVTKIVTAPFALLANLIGVEADELEFIVFDPGQSDLAPPEVEKTAKIAEALSLRPELALQVGGVFAEDEDGEAIRTGKVDALIESRIEALDDEGMYAENRQAVIESLFTESGIAPDPAAALAEVRAANTAPETEDSPGGFDALAYTESLRRQLIESQPVTEAELATLAGERANSVREAIAAAGPDIAARIVVDSSTEAVEAEDGSIPMHIRLTTGKELDLPEPQDVGGGVPVSFQCGDDGPAISVAFEGPETMSLDDGRSVRIVNRVRSASGARYAAEGVEFWNKGEEAMFTDGEAEYRCVKTTP